MTNSDHEERGEPVSWIQQLILQPIIAHASGEVTFGAESGFTGSFLRLGNVEDTE